MAQGEGGQLDVLHRAPRSSGGDELGLVEADDRFGQGVANESPTEPTDDTAPSGSQPLGVADGQVLGGINRWPQRLRVLL